MRRFLIARRGQAGFELGDAVVRGAQARGQPVELLLLAQQAVGQILDRALLFSEEHFQGVEAGGWRARQRITFKISKFTAVEFLLISTNLSFIWIPTEVVENI